MSGSCSCNFDDEYEVTVNKGDILYLAYNADYKMTIHTENYRYIYCDFELNDNVIRSSNVYSFQNTSDVENLFIKLVKNYNIISKSFFMKCVSLVYNIYSMILMTTENIALGETKEEKIVNAKGYVDNNFSENKLSVSMLADNAEISEVYFRKLFILKYNITPAQYITSTRIKKAKQLLKYSFMTLEECAYECGF